MMYTTHSHTQVSHGKVAGLPLRISSFQPISPEFRYTSLWPPMRHPLAMASKMSGVGAASNLKSVGSVVHPLEVVLTFESTTDWPDEVHAIRATKQAFYLQLATLLRSHHSSTVRVIVTRSFLDVLYQGYAFRVHIYVPRELTLLRQHRETLALVHRTARSAGSTGGANAFPVPPSLTREKLGLVEHAQKKNGDGAGDDDGDEETPTLAVGDALLRVGQMADSIFRKFEVSDMI